ncbi:hypothetical protein EJ04DRAFT_479844, partial [Polyplosphaeria fusca]
MSMPPGAIITALYPRKPDLTFDTEYYISHHIPLFTKLWRPYGAQDVYFTEAQPGSEYAYCVTLHFRDIEGWERAVGNEEEMGEIVGDVKNFTNGEAVFVVGRVV